MKTIRSTSPFCGPHSKTDTSAGHGVAHRPFWLPAVSGPMEPFSHQKSLSAQHEGKSDLLTEGPHQKTLAVLYERLKQLGHTKLRNHLATMSYRVAVAVATFSDSKPHVLSIDRIYLDFLRRLWTHMFREEGLYANIRNLERAYAKPLCAASLLAGSIRVMRQEHRYFAKALRRIAALLREYELPQNATRTYRELVHGFCELEALKLQHMESEVALYTRALAIEKQLMGKRPKNARYMIATIGD